MRRPAEFLGEASGHDGCGTVGIAVMKKHGARGQAHHAEHSIERLRQHALDFAANETRGGQVEIGEREHIALDPALLLLVDGHHLQHGYE